MGRNWPLFFWEAKRLQDNFAAKLIAQGQLASQHVQMSNPVVDANTWQVDKPRVVIWGTKISHLWGNLASMMFGEGPLYVTSQEGKQC